MEEASRGLGLGDLTKQNIHRTLDQIQDQASSVLLLTVQWKDIEEQFDSTRNALEARAKEVEALEESIKGRILEVEKKEERLRLVEASGKELGSVHESIKDKLNELEKREKEFGLKQKVDIERRRVELELIEVSSKQLELVLESVEEKFKELETKAKGFVMFKKSSEESFKDLKALEESIQKVNEELVLNLTQLKNCAKNFEARRKWFGDRFCNFESNSMEKNKEIELKEKKIEEWAKELEAKEKELISAREKLRLESEPLVSFLSANLGSSFTTNLKCSQFYLNENQDNGIDGLSKNRVALASVVLSLDPAKLVLDAIEGFYWPHLKKGDRELDGSFAGSCIPLLEKLMKMNPTIEPEVKKEATRLAIEWVDKAARNPENTSQVLGCLLFVAVYGLASFFTPQELLNLLECVLSYNQAPKLFQLLGLYDKVSGVIESLIKKEEYFPAIKFICEFKLFKFNPGPLMFKYLNNLEKAAQKIAGTDEQKAFTEKQKADVLIAFEYIKEKKLEHKFPVKVLKKLLARLEKQLGATKAMPPVHESEEKCQSTCSGMELSGTFPRTEPIIPSEQRNGAKRQRTPEQMVAPYQNSTVNGVGNGAIHSGAKIEESGENRKQAATASFSFPSTGIEPNVLSNPINRDASGALVVNHSVEEADLFRALRCAPDPAKQVLNSAMVLYPTNLEGEYEFELRVSSGSCLLLLNQLKMMSPQIQLVKDEAKKLAVAWKSKLSKNKSDHVEVVCFLMFLVIFGVASEFKANDLLALLENGYWRTVSPDLCQSLGLTNAIPGFIQNMIKTGQRLRAINYIYALDVVESFPPVSIINDFLRFTKKSAEWSCENAKNVTALQVVAMNKQIKALRDAIKCILHHKLESQFQVASIKQEIKSLFEEKSKLKTRADGPKPDSADPQTQKPKADSADPQTEKPKADSADPQTQKPKADAVEVESGPITSTSRTSAITKPSIPSPLGTFSFSGSQRGRKWRGIKRRWQRSMNYRGRYDIASHPSNHHPDVPVQDYGINPMWEPMEYNRRFNGHRNSMYNYTESRVEPQTGRNHHHPHPYHPYHPFPYQR